MLSKVKTSILIILILLSALLWAVHPAQAMKRESFDRPVPAQIEILRGEAILVNTPSGVEVWEV